MVNPFKSIWAKLVGVLTVIGGFLALAFLGERSKRKAAELEASIEKGNREHLEKERDIISNIDEEREEWKDQKTDEAIYNAQYLEELKHEKDNLSDADFAARIARLHNKDAN